MPKPCHRALVANVHAARESAWSDIFELNATTIPQQQLLLHLPQTPRRPPRRLKTTSSMPCLPRSLTLSSLLHSLRRPRRRTRLVPLPPPQ
ncbi:unnamed protein product [Schistocephalus solidus]|uniref:Uncharacterized protein n=1 Tax=Schistocephalus solidus TaxID=70667 RepID=A0A183SMA4_SCHSO|nr:unnamed protein product [Schistocephalus solidus]